MIFFTDYILKFSILWNVFHYGKCLRYAKLYSNGLINIDKSMRHFHSFLEHIY